MEVLPVFLFDGPLNGEDLSDRGEVEISVRRRRCPHSTAFDTPMLQGWTLAEIRFTAISELRADIGGQRGLIVLGDDRGSERRVR